MLHLTKKRKLELIQEMIEILDVKAYEIAKNTTLSDPDYEIMVYKKRSDMSQAEAIFYYIRNAFAHGRTGEVHALGSCGKAAGIGHADEYINALQSLRRKHGKSY